MGLEHTPELFVRIIVCGMECRADLGRVMCVVINDGDAIDRALDLETTVGSGKGS